MSFMAPLKETFVSWTTQEKLDLLDAPISFIRWLLTLYFVKWSAESQCIYRFDHRTRDLRYKVNILCYCKINWQSVKSWLSKYHWSCLALNPVTFLAVTLEVLESTELMNALPFLGEFLVDSEYKDQVSTTLKGKNGS